MSCFKKILIIIVLIITFFLFSCKRDNKQEEPDLSKYEISYSDVNKDGELSFGGSYYSFFNLEDEINSVFLSLEIGEVFYAKFETQVDINDLIKYNTASHTYTVEGEIIEESDFNKVATYIKLFTKYTYDHEPYSCYPAVMYSMESMNKITVDEYNALSSDETSGYSLFVSLINPTNIITGKKYDFNIISRLQKDFEDLEFSNGNIKITKFPMSLNKNIVYEMNKNQTTVYYPLLSFGRTVSPIINVNGQEGMLIQGMDEDYTDNKLFYQYDHLYDSSYRFGDLGFSLTRIIKSICLEYDYIEERNIDYISGKENIFKHNYLFCPFNDLKSIIVNFTSLYNDYYQEIHNEVFVNKLESNDIIKILVNNITGLRYINYFFNSKIDAIKNDNDISLYQIDVNKDSGYYVVSVKTNSGLKYYRFDSSNDIDLENIDRAYYICEGKIVKNLSNNTDCNINVTIPLDITTYNDIDYYTKRGSHYMPNIKYVYDGFICGLDRDDINSILSNEDIVLGYDIKVKYLFDYNKSENKIGINVEYDKYKGEIPEDITKCMAVFYEYSKDTNRYPASHLYALDPVMYGNYFEHQEFTFSVDGNTITIND